MSLYLERVNTLQYGATFFTRRSSEELCLDIWQRKLVPSTMRQSDAPHDLRRPFFHGLLYTRFGQQ